MKPLTILTILTLLSQVCSFGTQDVKERKILINVEGIVGVGKTTFLNFFEPYSCVAIMKEPVEKWRHLNGTNMLDLIYKNPARWSTFQESYVMYTMLENTLVSEPFKIMERSINSCRNVFIEFSRLSGMMQKHEYFTLDQWFQMLQEQFHLESDLTVYLRVDPQIALDRIFKRGRPEEQGVRLDFLQKLHSLHEDWLVHKNSSFPLPSKRVITIDADKSYKEMSKTYKKMAKFIVKKYFNECK